MATALFQNQTLRQSYKTQNICLPNTSYITSNPVSKMANVFENAQSPLLRLPTELCLMTFSYLPTPKEYEPDQPTTAITTVSTLSLQTYVSCAKKFILECPISCVAKARKDLTRYTSPSPPAPCMYVGFSTATAISTALSSNTLTTS
jgi:hypothetical protein